MAERGRAWGPGAVLGALLWASIGTAEAVELTGETLTGWAQVIAGDTIQISGRALRLLGVAVPGGSAPGAADARLGLYRLVDSRIVICHLTRPRVGPALLAGCEAGGKDIGALLGDRGFARDCAGVSGGRYRIQEARAKAGGHAPAALPLPPECRHP